MLMNTIIQADCTWFCQQFNISNRILYICFSPCIIYAKNGTIDGKGQNKLKNKKTYNLVSCVSMECYF